MCAQKMAKATTLIRQCISPRQPRRQIYTTSSRGASTSPQRRPATTPGPAHVSSPKPFADIPGPIAMPMLRHSAHVLPRIGSFHHTVGLGLLEGLREKYGDLVRLARATRSRPVLYVFDPEMMKEVYDSKLTEAPVWDKSPLCRQRKNATANPCPMHGDESKAIWTGIRSLLQEGALIRNYQKVFDDIASDATRRLGDLRHADNALNEELETEVYRWALETVGVVMLGIRLGCLDGAVHVPTKENRKPERISIDDDILDQCSLTKKSVDDRNPAERLVMCTREIADRCYLVRSEGTLRSDSQTFSDALKALDDHYSLTEHFLCEALKDLEDGDLRPEQVLLDKLRPLERQVLPLAADVLLAGVDPLAQTALSMFYHLSLHAAQQQRALDELHWAAASLRAGAGRPALPYVAACAREAMRLHPATGGVVRRSREALVVGGFEVPSGVDIVLAHGVASKNEKQWGRAQTFIPERWCAEGWEPLQASKAHPFASKPFGETCPASVIVGHMLSALVTRVLDQYRLEWHGPPPKLVTTGVNRLQPPYYFVLQNAA